jgi:chromosome segregation ATPase
MTTATLELTCDYCGAEAGALDDDSYCPRCAAAAAAHAEAEETYSDAVSEHEEAEAEVEGLEAELAEVRERLAVAKGRMRDAARVVVKSGQRLADAEAELDRLAG